MQFRGRSGNLVKAGQGHVLADQWGPILIAQGTHGLQDEPWTFLVGKRDYGFFACAVHIVHACRNGVPLIPVVLWPSVHYRLQPTMPWLTRGHRTASNRRVLSLNNVSSILYIPTTVQRRRLDAGPFLPYLWGLRMRHVPYPAERESWQLVRQPTAGCETAWRPNIPERRRSGSRFYRNAGVLSQADAHIAVKDSHRKPIACNIGERACFFARIVG